MIKQTRSSRSKLQLMNTHDKEKPGALRMRGKVRTYSSAVNAGVIIGENKKIYLFFRGDWISSKDPAANLYVVFSDDKKRARSILTEEENSIQG